MRDETLGTPPVLTVKELVARLKRLVEGDPFLQRVWVVGELSGVKRHTSGHWYFTLKDEAQIRAVMFRRDAEALRFQPTDGQTVLALGRVGVYERDGQTQLYVQHLEPYGVGRYFLELEALKARLAAEGLFSRPKRSLPQLPRAVGVVTSRVGAALQDIRTVARRRFPGIPLIVAPVLVQGEGAPDAIVRGLARIAQHPGVDVVILARGGGSREDLNAFNDERVVRQIARMPVPVVSAVGHEVDVTLADLAADVRAPTPSAAAEIVVPERQQLLGRVRELGDRLRRQLAHRLQQERWKVRALATHGVLKSPEALLTGRRMAAAQLRDRLETALARKVAEARRKLVGASAAIGALNPVAVLARGFSVVTDDVGRPVTARAVRPGQRLTVEWVDGAWAVAANHPTPPALAGFGGNDEGGHG
jgi:exodeoxyribonuclease VII large subunit